MSGAVAAGTPTLQSHLPPRAHPKPGDLPTLSLPAGTFGDVLQLGCAVVLWMLPASRGNGTTLSLFVTWGCFLLSVPSQGMGYLHAKGILHKDLKSKNVFYDNGKVVITDFGLFSISGVLQAGR